MMAALAAEVANPALPVYPNPAPDNCSTCVFQAPCIAMNAGADPGLRKTAHGLRLRGPGASGLGEPDPHAFLLKEKGSYNATTSLLRSFITCFQRSVNDVVALLAVNDVVALVI